MVQKEITKKTRTYGLIGLLLAVMLVATVYGIATTPNFSQPSPSVTPTPNISPSPSLTPFPSTSPAPEVTPMKTFTSYNELKDFLNQSNSQNIYAFGATDEFRSTAGALPSSTNPVQASVTTAAQATNTKDFSTTNIQVAGVDEADTVKTDGKYLYVIGNNSQVVYFLDANPQNAKVLAKIFLNNTHISGVYLSNDGSKLAVVGNQYIPYDYFQKVDLSGGYTILPMPYYNSGASFVYVYNIANKANPVLSRNFTMTGNYVNSRLIGDYIYDIVTENAILNNGVINLPTVFSGPTAASIAPSRIYYANTSDTYYSYTTIVSLNIMNDALQPTNKTIMMGGAGNIYVSESNIYVTYPIATYKPVPVTTPVPIPAVRDKNGTDIVTIMPMPIIWQRPSWQGTEIYRIHIFAGDMSFAAQGNVTGSVMNQYSMDESNGYFRIATTSYDYTNDNYWSGTQQNNVYVLDMYLNTVGRLENLASGETLHAARFMGNRCYLVTFQQVDPLFVVDLSQPTSPKVLGNLTIPGYSDFLQPYDATHLIGIGQDVNASIDADKVHTPGAVYYTAILGLKVSLFDVSDVANPKEISKFVVGDRGTTSEALNDPKAILFDASRNLLVLPVDLYLASNKSATPSTSSNNAMPSLQPDIPAIDSSFVAYPQLAWQGVYVFNISVNGGLVVRGNVTQMDNAAALLANPSLAMMNSYQWVRYDQFISRSVYIGNMLYTFSSSRVQLNSLDNFALIAKIDLN
jgi:inhibitor of cysteine peptidase